MATVRRLTEGSYNGETWELTVSMTSWEQMKQNYRRGDAGPYGRFGWSDVNGPEWEEAFALLRADENRFSYPVRVVTDGGRAQHFAFSRFSGGLTLDC